MMRSNMMRGRFLAAALTAAALFVGATPPRASLLPYAAAGLTERQAAAHLLDRFTFGARPGDVDSVLARGLDAWLEDQLDGALPDPSLESMLAALPSTGMSEEEIVRMYPRRTALIAMAVKDGAITDSDRVGDRAILKTKLDAYAQQKGMRSEGDLMNDLMEQKVLRGVYARNQLREVLTDFWFNHLYVATTDNQAQRHILSYERDAIRPNVLGHFRALLEASARHPAMLYYLDNAESTAPESVRTAFQQVRSGSALSGRPPKLMAKPLASMGAKPPRKGVRGINENYARELMELHTLGVDGGYAQHDVVEVARALTGWTVMPEGAQREKLEERLAGAAGKGFVRDGEFLFRPDLHDAGEKTILGVSFPAGHGMDEGERVLDMVASNPATAHHLALKIARRFVSDDPPASLVDRLAARYTATGGDLRAVIREVAESPEFWSPQAMRAKVKSPFELAVSAVRGLNADVEKGRPLARWVAQMGEPLYAYQAPTGYPDRGDAWINSGALLTRMNFGLKLASNGIPGVRVNLRSLDGGREPESVESALATYGKILMPERNLEETLRLLRPMISDPDLPQKVATAAGAGKMRDDGGEMTAGDGAARRADGTLPLVVGVIVGSPEFQRR